MTEEIDIVHSGSPMTYLILATVSFIPPAVSSIPPAVSSIPPAVISIIK